jgi:hypothetical protein
MFYPKRDEERVNKEKLHNEELHDLYCSHNIVQVIKSRRMRWVGHVVRIGEGRNLWKETNGETQA